MNKVILSVSGALFFTVCTILTYAAFLSTGEGLLAIIALVCAFGVIAFIIGGIEDTKLADKIGNLFIDNNDDVYDE